MLSSLCERTIDVPLPRLPGSPPGFFLEVGMTTNGELRAKYPIGSVVRCFHGWAVWVDAEVIGYRHYAHGAQTLVVRSPAGEIWHLTGGEQAYMYRLPDRQLRLV